MKLNGCHNRQPFKTEQLMQDGWIYTQGGHTRVPRMVRVPFRMSQDCKYSKDPMNYGQQDPACTGCKHKDTNEIHDQLSYVFVDSSDGMGFCLASRV